MAHSNANIDFPSQVVSDQEKASWEYGSQVAMAIEYEWFRSGRTNGNRYLTNFNNSCATRLSLLSSVILILCTSSIIIKRLLKNFF